MKFAKELEREAVPGKIRLLSCCCHCHFCFLSELGFVRFRSAVFCLCHPACTRQRPSPADMFGRNHRVANQVPQLQGWEKTRQGHLLGHSEDLGLYSSDSKRESPHAYFLFNCRPQLGADPHFWSPRRCSCKLKMARATESNAGEHCEEGCRG